jgi:hypothetical protein
VLFVLNVPRVQNNLPQQKLARLKTQHVREHSRCTIRVEVNLFPSAWQVMANYRDLPVPGLGILDFQEVVRRTGHAPPVVPAILLRDSFSSGGQEGRLHPAALPVGEESDCPHIGFNWNTVSQCRARSNKLTVTLED